MRFILTGLFTGLVVMGAGNAILAVGLGMGPALTGGLVAGLGFFAFMCGEKSDAYEAGTREFDN